jgi:YVTN family beta-propeller protein
MTVTEHCLANRSTRLLRGAWALVLIVVPHSAFANSHLDLSADGRWLAVANRDNGTISVVDTSLRVVLREVPVGHHPESVAFLGKSSRIAVSVYGDDQLAIVDAQTGEVVSRMDVGDEPYGLAVTQSGDRLYVSCEYPGEIVVIDAAQGQVIDRWRVGRMLRGLALSEREHRLYATEYLSCDVLAVSTQTGAVEDRWPGTPSENLARQIVVHPTRPKAYLPHIRSRVNVDQGEGAIVPFVTVVQTRGGEGRRRQPIGMDGFHGVYVVANPWEVAMSHDGRRLAVVFAGTNDAYLCRVVDDDFSEIRFDSVLSVGTNPRAVVFSNDGRHLYVLNALDFTVDVFDVQTSRRVETISVCANPHSEQFHRGKVLFYSALQPMVGRRWISCASCHPDGDADGRTWQNAEGLRNTTGLAGMAWTHPIHWSADRDEVQDFELTIRSPLMQGRGLIRGAVSDPLGTPHRGRSADLDALAVYSNSHKVSLSPHARGGLSEAAQRGREVFFSRETRCAECHRGAFFTDSQPVSPFRRHNVGTGDADPSETLGPEYDTPSLLGLYRSAPYLHHGQAATLRDVLTTFNRDDRHGKTSHLTDAQRSDLEAFLNSLPFTDPIAQAEAEGLTRIVDEDLNTATSRSP